MKDIKELNEYLVSNNISSITIQELNTLILARKSFNYNKFYEWLITKNVFFMSNSNSFIKKCGFIDISNGVFDKKIKTPYLKPLLDDLKAKGIYYHKARDTSYLDTYLTYILTEELMEESDLSIWLHSAVNYIKTLEKPNAKYFKDLFRKSKTMKALNLPYEWLDEMAQKEKEEWEETIDGINKKTMEIIQLTYGTTK